MRPEDIETNAEAHEANHGHPDAGHDVDAALGEGANATVPLPPSAAPEGVEAEGEAQETDQGEKQASGERKRHDVNARNSA
jgi:hypothetical protein